jgi:hypothetical protein
MSARAPSRHGPPAGRAQRLHRARRWCPTPRSRGSPPAATNVEPDSSRRAPAPASRRRASSRATARRRSRSAIPTSSRNARARYDGGFTLRVPECAEGSRPRTSASSTSTRSNTGSSRSRPSSEPTRTWARAGRAVSSSRGRVAAIAEVARASRTTHGRRARSSRASAPTRSSLGRARTPATSPEPGVADGRGHDRARDPRGHAREHRTSRGLRFPRHRPHREPRLHAGRCSRGVSAEFRHSSSGRGRERRQREVPGSPGLLLAAPSFPGQPLSRQREVAP